MMVNNSKNTESKKIGDIISNGASAAFGSKNTTEPKNSMTRLGSKRRLQSNVRNKSDAQ